MTVSESPLVTILLPIRNEAAFIERSLGTPLGVCNRGHAAPSES